MNDNGAGAEILLDARMMEPPEPFATAMNILQQLQAGQFLHMVHRRKPRLLYPELNTLGLTSHTLCHDDETYHIIVWRDEDESARNAAETCIETLKTESI